MKLDGNGTRSDNGHSGAPVDNARAALVSLLNTKRLEKAPSQEHLAKKLKKEIEDLRSLGVSFDAISAHLKSAGIIISKNTLGAAVKKKTRRRIDGANSGSGTSKAQSTNTALSV